MNAEATDPEDAKLATLARSARVRAGADEGAAVRDAMGRTYVAAAVDIATLRLTALQAAVAAAVSSGADSIEAAAVDGAAELDGRDRDLLAELGVGTVLVVGPDSDPAAR